MRELTPLELDHITLEGIQQMKSEVRSELDLQKADFIKKSQQLMYPFGKGAAKGNGLIGTLRTGYAIFTGITTGIRIMRSIRGMFR